MSKLILILTLSLSSLSVQAGFFSSFVESVAANSVTGGGESYINSDLKSMRKYLQNRNAQKIKTPGYKAFTDALESTNDIEFLSTAAYTHYINGNNKESIRIYEQKLLPIARIRGRTVYEVDYKTVAGLPNRSSINYDALYEKNQAIKNKIKRKLLKKEDKPRGYMKIIVYGFILLAGLLLAGIIVGIMIFIRLKGIQNNTVQRNSGRSSSDNQ